MVATDWVNGALYRLHPDGKADQLMDLNKGSADLEFVENSKLAIIPMMIDGKVTAFKVNRRRGTRRNSDDCVRQDPRDETPAQRSGRWSRHKAPVVHRCLSSQYSVATILSSVSESSSQWQDV